MYLTTSRLADSLKARKVCSCTDITGLEGGITSSYQVEVNVGLLFRIVGETLNVVVHGVQCFSSGYPHQDLATIRQMPLLQGLHLANPEFGRSGHVDLLLEVTHCNPLHMGWSKVFPRQEPHGIKNNFRLGHRGAVNGSSGVKSSSRLLQQTQGQMSCYQVLGHGKGAWRKCAMD